MILTLELVGGPHAGEARAIDGNMAFSVGTEHGATWVLAGAGGAARLDIRLSRDGFVAEAGGQVEIEGQPVADGTVIALAHGSRIGLGDAELRASVEQSGARGLGERYARATGPTVSSILADVTPGGDTASGVLPGRDGETWLESITGPGGALRESRYSGYGGGAPRPSPVPDKPLATYLPEDWNVPGDRQNRLFQAQAASTAIGVGSGRQEAAPVPAPVPAPVAPQMTSDALLKAAGIAPGEIATAPERQLVNAGAALREALSGIARLERSVERLRDDLGLPLRGATTPVELDPFVILSDEDGLSARSLAARIGALEHAQAALIAGIRAHLSRARALLDPDAVAASVPERRGVFGRLAPGAAEWQAYRAIWAAEKAADVPLSEAALTQDIEAAETGDEFKEPDP